MHGHCFIDGLNIPLFQRVENIQMLTQQHFRGGDVVEAHVAHAVDGGFDVFDGVPGELAVGNLRQQLVKLIIERKEIAYLLAVDSNALLVQVLLPAGSTENR